MSVKRETVEQRKALPLASGVLDYFPDALLVVAEVSRVGNEQHHPGEPLHWDKSKSSDEADALLRHLLDRGTIDTDGLRHSGKVAWRALAMLQRELDAEALARPGEPCVCHTPSIPVGAEHVKAVSESVAFMGQDRPTWVAYGAGHEVASPEWSSTQPCCGQTKPEHNLRCLNYR